MKVTSRKEARVRGASRRVVSSPGNAEISRGGEEEPGRQRNDARGEKRGAGETLVTVRRGLIRQFVPRRPYRMLIKRVSTVSKYLTAAAARRGDCGPIGTERVRSHGIVFGEPWSLMYASGLARWSRGTVWVVHVLLPRHSPMLRALLCALYTLSLSLSPSVSPALSHSLLTLPFSFPSASRCISPSRSRLPVALRSPYGVIRTRETLSPSLFLFLPTGLSVSLLAPHVSFLVRFSSRKFAHLVTRSNTVGYVVAAARSV